jgi:hypothetical protein
MTTIPVPAQIGFDASGWSIEAEEVRRETHLGRAALFLRNGRATLTDLKLTDCVLEVDVALGQERSFTGVTWRVASGDDLECFFLRPHQAGNPDATQYTPVFNGVFGWQLYHGDRYTVPLAIPFGEWLRVRVVVTGRVAEIFVGSLDRPALVIDDLKRPAADGAIGLLTNEAPAWFSRFAFAELTPAPVEERTAEPARGVVPAWSVSDAFAEADVAESVQLPPGALAGRSWTTLTAEPDGLCDLARANGLRDGRNTVFARVTVATAAASIRGLDLGFSDRARVWLNGRLLFLGADEYRSRDYRFLGSIGWWDALYLPLEAGENELVVAVSEDFGGWGVQARFPDAAGLTFGI